MSGDIHSITLKKTLMKTGSNVGDAITNMKQLIEEHQPYLELRQIYNYDAVLVSDYPSLAIVFDRLELVSTALNAECVQMNVFLTLFYYLESLQFDKDTYSHIIRVGNLAEIIFAHNNLYRLTSGLRMEVLNAALVGRRLQNDVILTGQVDVKIPMKICVTMES